MSLDFTNKTVAVTGAGGLLGRAVCAALAAQPCRLLRLARQSLPALSGRATIEDITYDLNADGPWQQALAQADIVLHLAAQTSVYTARTDPAADLRTNVEGTVRVLEAARAGGKVPTVILASTVTIYGLQDKLPVSEDSPDQPISFYCLGKQCAEAYLKRYCAEGWIKGAALRLANLYGPGTVSANDRGVLVRIAQKALAGEDIPVFGSGEYWRDYIALTDAAAAFLRAALAPETVNGGHFILASGQGILLRDAFALVAERAALRTGRASRLVTVPPPDGLSPIEFRNFIGDVSRLRQACGWQPTIALADGIDTILDNLAKDTDRR